MSTGLFAVLAYQEGDRIIVEPFVTIAEVAETFAVNERTVRNWIADGKITAYRLAGRLIRIDPQSLELLYEPVQYQGRNSTRPCTTGGRMNTRNLMPKKEAKHV